MYRGARIGGEWWRVRLVPPSSPFLVDRTGRRTVATTDTRAREVYVSTALHGRFLETVLAHEFTHVAMNVYGIESWIDRNVPPWSRVPLEESIANLIADHGTEIIAEAGTVGDDIARN